MFLVFFGGFLGLGRGKRWVADRFIVSRTSASGMLGDVLLVITFRRSSWFMMLLNRSIAVASCLGGSACLVVNYWYLTCCSVVRIDVDIERCLMNVSSLYLSQASELSNIVYIKRLYVGNEITYVIHWIRSLAILKSLT